MRVRDLAYPWIKIKIRDGRSTRFWTDNWSSFGNIRELLRLPSSSALGIRPTSTLHDIHRNGVWLIPAPRSDVQVEIHAFLTTITLNTDEDRYEWCPNGSATPVFSTGEIYRLIKHHQPLVPWNKVVWSPSFLTWLVVLNRCPTKDRILSLGLQTNSICILCNLADETRDHLFFDWNFSSMIWEALARKARCSPISTCPQLLQYLQQRSCPKPERILGLLTWQVAMYYTWTERNSRLHRQCYRSSNSITVSGAAMIRNKISSFRDSNPRLASAMFQLWVSS